MRRSAMRGSQMVKPACTRKCVAMRSRWQWNCTAHQYATAVSARRWRLLRSGRMEVLALRHAG